jgi:hypothetical protein
MRIKAVRRYATPDYPTRDYLMEHPELLRWIPKRWQHNRLVLGTLGLIVPLILARPTLAQDAKDATVRVAPLFVHGEGRGAFGCIVINPPVFLSEDEAREVIRDEAKKAGIEFTDDGLTLKDASVPVTDRYNSEARDKMQEAWGDSSQENSTRSPQMQKRDLVLDGYDKKHGIAFEFISERDFKQWESQDRRMISTASNFDFKTTAERLAQGLAKTQGDAIVAVFYEPSVSPPNPFTAKHSSDSSRPSMNATKNEQETHQESPKKAAKELGKKELREQVRDFLGWLKSQGVI